MYHWKLAVATNLWQRQQAEIWDPSRTFPMGMPKLHAPDDAIMLAERAIGVDFAEDYKDFLRHVDGWPHFCENMDLFGTQDFISGEAARLLARNTRAVTFMRGLGFGDGEYVAVGGIRNAHDLFLLISAHHANSPGEVIWYDSDDEDPDRYPSFCDFFSSMIDLNEELAQRGAERIPERPNQPKRYPRGYRPTEFKLADE